MRRQFRDTVMDLAKQDDGIVMVLGDVSVYLFNDFKTEYSDRFYNMGICENTLISVAAGLSSQGFSPFVHSIAPFITETRQTYRYSFRFTFRHVSETPSSLETPSWEGFT